MLDLRGVYYQSPTTWPKADDIQHSTGADLSSLLRLLYERGVFLEIEAIMTKFPDCAGVGHVVLQALCCALDGLSAFVSPQ